MSDQDKRISSGWAVEVGDTVKWQGQGRRVIKLLSINVALDGVEDVICLPVDATRAELLLPRGIYPAR